MRWLARSILGAVLVAGGLSYLAMPASAQESVTLQERFPAGYHYHVSTRVQLNGTLRPPPMSKDKPAGGPLALTGESAIEYDERVLEQGGDDRVRKTARIYRRFELQRKLGDKPQQGTVRPAVRRLILLRLKTSEVPFSPDGPLAWGEIDLVRTDVFTPELAGLLPDRAVVPGDRWTASAGAVQELTDLEGVDGQLECRFEQITMLSEGRRHARISFSGNIRGVNEDGPNRQQLDGYLFFDMESKHVSYLSLKGLSLLLDKEGKELGRVEGQFVLTRRPTPMVRELNDEAFRGVSLEPNADNTRLLYDNADLGVRFLHPRRWRVQGVRGTQVALDSADGSGLLLTLDPVSRIPSGDQFMQESLGYLQKQKTKVTRTERPRMLQSMPQYLEQFGLEVETNGQSVWMEYYVARQARGGATLAARLLTADLAGLRKEVDGIARSIVITRDVK